jgi:hypothetical protein
MLFISHPLSPNKPPWECTVLFGNWYKYTHQVKPYYPEGQLTKHSQQTAPNITTVSKSDKKQLKVTNFNSQRPKSTPKKTA